MEEIGLPDQLEFRPQPEEDMRQRVEDVYLQMLQSGYLTDSDLSYEEKVTIVESFLDHCIEAAHECYAINSSHLSGVYTRSEWLRLFVSGATVERLREFQRGKNWRGTGESIGDFARMALGRQLNMVIKHAGLFAHTSKVSANGIVEIERLSADDYSLRNTIHDLMDTKRIPPAAGGQLLLLFEIVEVPEGTPPEVEYAAIRIAAARMREQLFRQKSVVDVTDGHLKRGIKLLAQLIGGVPGELTRVRTMATQLVEEGRYDTVDAAVADIETYIAYVLRSWYNLDSTV